MPAAGGSGGIQARVILTFSGVYLAVEICAKLCSVLCPPADRLRKEFCELCSEQLV